MGKYPTLKGIKMMELEQKDRQKNGYDCGVLVVAAATLVYQKEEAAGLQNLSRQTCSWRSRVLIELADRLRSAPLPDVEAAAAPLKHGAHALKKTATDEHTNDATERSELPERPRKRSWLVGHVEVEDAAMGEGNEDIEDATERLGRPERHVKRVRLVDHVEVEDAATGEDDEGFMVSGASGASDEEDDGSEGEESDEESVRDDDGELGLGGQWGRRRAVTGFEHETRPEYLARIKTLKGEAYKIATWQRRSLEKKLRSEAEPAYAAKMKQRQRKNYLRQRKKAGYEIDDDLVADEVRDPNVVMAPYRIKEEVDEIVDAMVKDPEVAEGISGRCPFECLAGVGLLFTGHRDDPLRQRMRVTHGHLLFQEDMFVCTGHNSGFASACAKSGHYGGFPLTGQAQEVCEIYSCG
ncbi:hypothetical protein LTR56_000372 [Elasticomyces elasticus]|nr:hypothetical protein LTR56_000372 [Elasticomyces elasticus]KAK3666933.1 hypothetical protein LTR22_002158 [Elasticomyces elasticus]KAK4933365.1 hypothetical protein LTR49_000359 [Elasticomyces elasticus]KAK5755543.1 hypothetical protein LTS12_014411 [Elasticomyces elasticus]